MDRKLSELKAESVNTYHNWVEGGRLHIGHLNEVRLACKARFKQDIREAKGAIKREIDTNLVDALLEHDSKDFWRKWRRSFRHAQNNVNVVSLKSCPHDICDGFVESFKNNFKNSGDFFEFKSRYITKSEQYMMKTNCDLMLSESDVEAVIKTLKVNKATGSDGLMAKHLKFSGRRLLFFITKLFNGCLKHGFVPDSFTSSIIIPATKDNGNQCDKFDEYRPVSLVTIFSKAFESCLLELLQRIVLSEELQFGFTAGKGCQKALMLLNCISEHFNKGGSVFYATALDTSKAFDKVSHYGLFIKLMESGIPVNMLNTFVN